MKAYRTAVRGHCFSLIMPWEDIMKCLDGMMSDAELSCLPWGPECLKYLVRLQLKVAGKDFEQHLKQVKLRPFILVMLLKELINRRQGPFADDARAAAFMERMERAVAERYPEHESDIPISERNGTIPPGIIEEIENDRRARAATHKDVTPAMANEKNATRL